MKKATKERIAVILAALGFSLLIALGLTGCAATETIAKGISEKSISGSGTFIHSRAGLDKQTQTPELSTLFVWGDYTSVVPGDEVFRLEESSDSSIFNSSAVTKKRKVFFSSGDKKRMDQVIKSVTKQEGDSSDMKKNGQGT